jgi:ribonuclease HII
MICAGIDEAGLGPILGPYCAGLTLFESPKQNLYELLSAGISKTPEKGKTAVGDSKKLYTPAKGMKELEKTVLSFYSLLHGEPGNFENFLKKLSPDKPAESPWFSHCNELSLPLVSSFEEINENRVILEKTLSKKGVTLRNISLRFIPAVAFNRGLDKTVNKGTLCQELLNPLMEHALKEENLLLTVDRQGGRRFYGDWLINLLPRQPLQAQEELAKSSVYRSGSKTIRFLVGGDDFALETALASLFAKYARECSMLLFNQYWKGKAGDIKKTAGYYKDGMRFIEDLKKSDLLPEDRNILIRKK